MTNRIRLTVSGLCIVQIQAIEGDPSAKGVQILIPDSSSCAQAGCSEHAATLTIALADFDGRRVPANLLYGPTGENLVSVDLENEHLEIASRTLGNQEWRLDWASPKLDGPLFPNQEGYMDWLITTEELGMGRIDPSRISGSVRFSGEIDGQIRASRIVRTQSDEPILFDRGRGSLAVADDTMLEFDCDNPIYRLERAAREFSAGKTQGPIDICVSNDVPKKTGDSNNHISNRDVLHHLSALRSIQRDPENELQIPTPTPNKDFNRTDPETGVCAQGIAFVGDGLMKLTNE